MPQIFQVLRCYKCSAFQIHHMKKSNKFECKICGEKQSIKRHYGMGTGKDCRMHVQKLNVLRGNKDNKPTIASNSDEECGDSDTDKKISENIVNSLSKPVKRSKWSTFLDAEKEIEETEEPMYLGDQKVYLEIPQKTKSRKFKSKARGNSEVCLDSVNNGPQVELKSFRSCTNINSEVISTQDDVHMNCSSVSNSCRKPLAYNNVDNLKSEKSLEYPINLQTVNKNSKWAQYVDIQEDDNLHSNILSTDDSKESVLNADNLFSLCDDSDIDQLLDI